MDLNFRKMHNAESGADNFFIRLLRRVSAPEKTEVEKNGECDDRVELLESIKKARAEWVNAGANYEFADEEQLIDYYTYNIKACEVRYEYLLKKAKEKGLKVESCEWKNLNANK